MQPDWITPRISGKVSMGCGQGQWKGVRRSQLLTCRFGSACVREAPIGLSAVSSWKLQAHSWFRLIFPSRLRWSLSYSVLKRKREEKRVCSWLRSKRKSNKIQVMLRSPTVEQRKSEKDAQPSYVFIPLLLLMSLYGHTLSIFIIFSISCTLPHSFRVHFALC